MTSLPEAKIELARRCEQAALAFDPRITNSEGGDFSDGHARYAYATSHGFAGEYRTSSFSLSTSPLATENGEMQRDGWYHVTRSARGWTRRKRWGGQRPGARCAGWAPGA
jgi:PmbA protein